MIRNKQIFWILALLFVLPAVEAQNLQQLPIDPNVRYGKLDNGLTYYIRHNAYPEKRANFYIAQKVGSIQEEDSQAGLAHFLEHMAFNGTKNFPGRKTMLNYLELEGARFGKDINAYTSFDETVYNLSDIPVTRTGIIDSCLLILHDWSSFITLEDAEIDKERNIIKEEWRTRTGAQYRIWDKTLPILFKGSKYADRMPIGKMDVIENFSYQTLKDYYNKWYRPDLQGIIIVGDIDVDEVESKIKTMFADIPKPQNPAERIYYPVADNEEPIVAITLDKEKTSTEVYIYYKTDIVPVEQRNTYEEYRRSIYNTIISKMISTRFEEINQKPESPITFAYAYKGNYFVAKTKDAWTLMAGAKESKADAALKVLAEENERMVRHGFTQAELDRVKSSVLKMYEDSYNNRNKQLSRNYVGEYVRSFLDGEAIPGIEYEYKLVQELLPSISLDEINKYAKSLSSDKNIVVSITGSEKEGLVYPAEKEVINILKQVESGDIAPYVEESIAENLLSKEPVSGKIIKEDRNESLGTVVWTLSNGAKVALKKTDFKDDQILLRATSKWGVDFYDDDQVINASNASSVMEMSGFGSFNATDLLKFMSGKSAKVGSYINANTVGVNGSSSVKDLEFLFQLMYLKFTEPRQDNEAYSAFKDRTKNRLKNIEANPYTALRDSVSFAQYGDNPRVKRMRVEDVDTKLDYDKMIEIYKECFSDAGSFVFSFVGNIEEESMRLLVEKYIASLPANKRSDAVEVTNDLRKGTYINRFNKEMENPKASVFNLYSVYTSKTQKNDLILSTTKLMLDMIYTDKIREEVGGTYGVSTFSYISRKPEGLALTQISFETDADKAVELNNLVHREYNNIATGKFDEEKYNKAKGQIAKSYEENIKQNGYWVNVLNDAYFYGEDNHTNYLSVLGTITEQDIKEFVRNTVVSENLIEVIMLPEVE